MSNRGFTLIELMIVTAIIGILAMIAFPSYGQYVVRANRTVAKTVIMRIASQQESYFSDRKQYATTLNVLHKSYPAGASVFVTRDGNATSATITTDSVYQVTLADDASGFRLEAAPVNTQAKDTKCGTLSFTANGAKGASGPDAANCWK